MMNKIEAVGIFVKSGVSDYGYAGFTILCKRPRQDDAHIRFTLETVLDPSITVGSVVEVTGCLRGYSYKDDEDGKWKVVTYLAATKVSLAKDKMFDVFGQKGHFAPPHKFDLFVEGTVSIVLNTGAQWKKLGIRIQGNREVADSATITLKNNPRISNEFDAIQKGDTIQAHINVQTPTKTYNGEKRVFMDLIVEDFFITNREIERSVPPSRTPEWTDNNNTTHSTTSNGRNGKRRKKNYGNSYNRVIDSVVVEGTAPAASSPSENGVVGEVMDDEIISTPVSPIM